MAAKMRTLYEFLPVDTMDIVDVLDCVETK